MIKSDKSDFELDFLEAFHIHNNDKKYIVNCDFVAFS